MYVRLKASSCNSISVLLLYYTDKRVIKAFILYDKVSKRDGGFNINESVLLNFLCVISVLTAARGCTLQKGKQVSDDAASALLQYTGN